MKYRSGKAEVDFELVEVEDHRRCYSYRITVVDRDDFEVVGSEFDCPYIWTDEMIAEYLFGCGMGKSSDVDASTLYNALEFNEYVADVDVPIVRRII